MKRTDFYIGLEFIMSGNRYRCTDVGTRVVVAIKLEDDLDSSWFKGPPYACPETVIDENDITGCIRE